MVRVPCCERMGMKKGPWTAEEDQILISYVQRYGHENWRALPKQAGLLRCGKSCRLRWTNYLRPDIKRGNFTKEEEETIIKLHQMLGNRWSAIATKLPGRTDNEIKNYWHTHLKKRVEEFPAAASGRLRFSSLHTSILGTNYPRLVPESWISNHTGSQKNGCNSHSAQPKHLGFFNFNDSSPASAAAAAMQCKQDQNLPTNSGGSPAETNNEKISAQGFSSTNKSSSSLESRAQISSTTGQSIYQTAGDECKNNDMLFWYNLFVNAGKSQESQEKVA